MTGRGASPRARRRPTSDPEVFASQLSIARKPDVTGDWMGHTWAAGSPDALFSPGTKLDGTSF